MVCALLVAGKFGAGPIFKLGHCHFQTRPLRVETGQCPKGHKNKRHLIERKASVAARILHAFARHFALCSAGTRQCNLFDASTRP
jgi:hypothetical protein